MNMLTGTSMLYIGDGHDPDLSRKRSSKYTHIATIKGTNHDTSRFLTTKSLFVVEIYKNIDQINMFFDINNHLIKRVDIKISNRRLNLFIYKRKRLGRTDAWFERELKLLGK